MMCVTRRKQGKIGLSRLLSEQVTYPFIVVFFETVLRREHSGDVSTKLLKYEQSA